MSFFKSKQEKQELRRAEIARHIKGWLQMEPSLERRMVSHSVECNSHGPYIKSIFGGALERKYFLATNRGKAIFQWVMRRQKRKASYPKI